MEQKLDKLFSIFEQPKKKDLFNLSIQQIIQLHKDSPQSVHYINKKIMKMIFSNVRDANLQAQHRKIASALIEHLYKNYTQQIISFLDDFNEDLNYSGLFQIGFLEKKSDQQEDSQTKNGIMEIENQKIYKNLQQVREANDIHLNQVDYQYMLKNETPLYAKQPEQVEKQAKIDQEEFNKKTMEIMERLTNVTPATIELLNKSKDNLENYIFGINQLYDQGSNDSEQETNDLDSEEEEQQLEEEEQKSQKRQKKKGNKRTSLQSQLSVQQEKMRKKIKQNVNVNENLEIEQQTERELQKQNYVKVVQNPFNVIFETCQKKLLDVNWKIRHATALVIRSFAENPAGFAFLGAQFEIKYNNENQDLSYIQILKDTRQNLIEYRENQANKHNKLTDITARSLLIIALDKFADYSGHTTNLIVRETASQILSLFMKEKEYLNDEDILEIVDLLRLYMQEQEWETRQSSLFLVKALLEGRGDLRGVIFEKIQEELLAMMDPDQVDDIIHLEGEIFIIYCQEDFFIRQSEYIDKLNTAVWRVMEVLDQITYATKFLVKLLAIFFEHNYIQGHQEIYLQRLSHLFFNKLIEVREQAYILVEKLFRQLHNNKKQVQQAKNIITDVNIYLLQAICIEENQSNFYNACNALATSFGLTDLQEQSFILNKLLEIGINYMTLNEVVKNFKYFGNYTYEGIKEDQIFESPLKHIDQIEFRLNKLALATKIIIDNNSEERIIKNFLESTIITTGENCRKLYFGLSVIGLMDINCKFQYINVDQLTKIQELDYLKYESFELKSYDDNILSNLHKLEEFSLIAQQNNLYERRKQYIQIYNILEAKPQKSDIEQILITQFVNFQSQVVEMNLLIKSLTSSILVEYYSLQQKQPPQLNPIILTFKKAITKEKINTIQKMIAQSFFKLFKLTNNKSQNRQLQSLNKDMLNKYQKPQIYLNFENDEEDKITRVLTYVKKYDSINFFYTEVFDNYKKQCEQNFPSLQDLFVIKQENNNNNLNNIKFIKMILPSLLNLNVAGIFLVPIINQLKQYILQNESIPEKEYKKIRKIMYKILLAILIKDLKNYNDENLNEFYLLQNSFLEAIFTLMEMKKVVVYQIIHKILSNNSQDFVEYASIFVLQVVSSITSQNNEIKDLSFKSLGMLITSLFLQKNQDKQGNFLNLTPQLLQESQKGRRFVLDFQNPINFQYDIMQPRGTELREYQKEGIKWMGFLCKYNLNGALCDDMGLGKTLQTLSIIQSEIFRLRKANKYDRKSKTSIVICPPTLQEHWKYEVIKFLDQSIKIEVFNPNLVFENYDIIVTSYSSVQQKFQYFGDRKYLFIILDEGHLIKNPDTKVSQAIKQLQGDHRFLLSGTPIQNNILELWSIFDFLMPGYLGSKEEFKKKYSKLFTTNLMAFSDKDLLFSEEQSKVLSELHKKVLPFIMRRDKITVLKDLPPKIIQDYPCDLSEYQQKLYHWLEDSHISKCEDNLVQQFNIDSNSNNQQTTQQQNNNDNDNNKQQQVQPEVCKNVLQMLIALRKVVNHPLMLDQKILGQLGINANKQLQSLEASGKFQSIRQLLIDLGFEYISKNESQGESAVSNNNSSSKDGKNKGMVYTHNTNKILMFSRFKQTLQLIENLILKQHFKKTKYLKLDGDIPHSQRFKIVNRFNEDGEIKILLITTSVGGLGLNLTSANCVIMIDHDYNPSNDMQAIDRAHRIGQKNTLNVYRMMTKNTLEEKIMGIQRFKVSVANAIINLDNATIDNVENSNIINLFDNLQQDDQEDKKKNEGGNKYQPYKKILSEMQDNNLDDLDFNKKIF